VEVSDEEGVGGEGGGDGVELDLLQHLPGLLVHRMEQIVRAVNPEHSRLGNTLPVNSVVDLPQRGRKVVSRGDPTNHRRVSSQSSASLPGAAQHKRGHRVKRW